MPCHEDFRQSMTFQSLDFRDIIHWIRPCTSMSIYLQNKEIFYMPMLSKGKSPHIPSKSSFFLRERCVHLALEEDL